MAERLEPDFQRREQRRVHESEVDAADAVAGEDVQFWSARLLLRFILLALRAEVTTHVAVRVLVLRGIHFETLHAGARQPARR